jgi:hypothetical protein
VKYKHVNKQVLLHDLKKLEMKKIILIGAVLLTTSSAILIANNRNKATAECCDKTKCEKGVCKPSDTCPDPDCCKQ